MNMPRKTKTKAKLGRADRYPSDYGVRDRERQEPDEAKKTNKSFAPGDKGQGREGFSKGYGGSEGKGTGPSGPERKESAGLSLRSAIEELQREYATSTTAWDSSGAGREVSLGGVADSKDGKSDPG